MSDLRETVTAWLDARDATPALMRRLDLALARASDARVSEALATRGWQGVPVSDADMPALRRMVGALGRPEDVAKDWRPGTFRVAGGAMRLTTWSPPGGRIPTTVLNKAQGL